MTIRWSQIKAGYRSDVSIQGPTTPTPRFTIERRYVGGYRVHNDLPHDPTQTHGWVLFDHAEPGGASTCVADVPAAKALSERWLAAKPVAV